MTKPVLSIIIISFNTAKITVDCLKSVLADKGLDFYNSSKNSKCPAEIIVIDNHSTDTSLTDIKKLEYPLKIIANKENVGFGKAINQALKVAQGNYILFLNSDTIILHSAISQSLDWLSSHPEAYGCTAQLLNSDKTIQPSGGYFPNIGNIITLLLHLDDLPFINTVVPPYHPHSPDFYTHDKYFQTDHRQDWVTGAFMLVRKNIITDIGGFSPDFFMYGEEMEMCYRIHQKFPQSQLWYLVGPQIIHLNGASSPNRQKIFSREYQGIILFFQKYRPLYQQFLVSSLIKVNQFLHSFIHS